MNDRALKKRIVILIGDALSALTADERRALKAYGTMRVRLKASDDALPVAYAIILRKQERST